MKKPIYLIALLSVCLFAGCADKKENDRNNEASVSEAEQQVTKEKLEYYDYFNGLSETENGCYFFSNSMRIIYIDKETMEATPLCFQPNCEHPSDESCPAYARYIRNLQLYKGKLYADITVDKDIEEDVCTYIYFYEMDLDGSNRRKVMELYNTEDLLGSESAGYSLCWYIIDDMVYISASQYGDEEKEGIAYIDRYSLSTGKKIDRLWEEKLKGSNDSVDYNLYVYDALRQDTYLTESRWEEVDHVTPDMKQRAEEEGITLDEDFGGVMVDKVNVPLPVCRTFYGTDKMFFLDNNKCYYLDKSKIGTGELQLQEIKGVK